jgi:hypothetical protein
MILSLKLFSTLSKTIVPISLAEKHHKHGDTSDFDAIEEIYSSAQENALFAVLTLSIIYNWFNTKPPKMYFGLVAVFLQVMSRLLLHC